MKSGLKNHSSLSSWILPTVLASLIPVGKKAKFKVKMDHHPLVEDFGNVSMVNTIGAAASENIVNALINFKGKYVMSKEAAGYFYAAIAGDSGRFQYASTSAHTFAIAGYLLESGLELSKIYQKDVSQATR